VKINGGEVIILRGEYAHFLTNKDYEVFRLDTLKLWRFYKGSGGREKIPRPVLISFVKSCPFGV